ncbi:hypothetical protein AgCh_025646 [Apium graveolens]
MSSTSSESKLTIEDLTLYINLEIVENCSQSLAQTFEDIIDFLCFPSDENDPLQRRFFKEDATTVEGFIKFFKLEYKNEHELLIVRANDGYINGFIIKNSEDEKYTAYITKGRMPQNVKVADENIKDAHFMDIEYYKEQEIMGGHSQFSEKQQEETNKDGESSQKTTEETQGEQDGSRHEKLKRRLRELGIVKHVFLSFGDGRRNTDDENENEEFEDYALMALEQG